MKQCKHYEDAFHYDCIICDENCEFRKSYNLIPVIAAISLLLTIFIITLL